MCFLILSILARDDQVALIMNALNFRLKRARVEKRGREREKEKGKLTWRSQIRTSFGRRLTKASQLSSVS